MEGGTFPPSFTSAACSGWNSSHWKGRGLVAKSDLEYNGAYPVADLRLYHRNARKGDVEAIKKSITIHGMYRPIVVNKGTHTGRENEVLAGNHTLKAIRDLGWDTVPVTLVDVDDEQAAKIVLVDNKTSDDASYNVELLTAELSALADLEGTGYSEADLDKLLNGLDDGEPTDSEHEEQYNNRWELVVECSDEEHQRELYQKFVDEGLTVRVLSL